MANYPHFVDKGGGGPIRKSPLAPVPAKPNMLYSRGSFVDMVLLTWCITTTLTEQETRSKRVCTHPSSFTWINPILWTNPNSQRVVT